MIRDGIVGLGGLGLFLLGMIVLTDGLRALAGGAITRALTRFTRSPASGAATGAIATALVQSSSATTVAAVGFVGAGILTFSQALGIIFGANLGTTVTGWMVALLGFKLKLGLLAPPLVLLGALLRLFGAGRLAATGTAVAGFGLVFVGIESLQSGLAGFQGIVTPDRFPADSWNGRLLLVGIGVVITLVTQSSSAGVAAALTAVHAGAISFPQAAAMVIGMDVGTTATAALATLGGSTATRRTGFAHVIYNALTAVAAFFLLDVYVAALSWIAPGALAREPELALVGFHTFFNGLGLLAVLPVTNAFARLVTALVPDRPSPFTRRLDPAFLGEPDVAIQAVVPTLEGLARQTFEVTESQLGGGPDRRAEQRFDWICLALDETRAYVQRLRTSAEQGPTWERHVSTLHVLDHLERLVTRAQRAGFWQDLRRDPELALRTDELRDALRTAQGSLGGAESLELESALRGVWESLEDSREPARRSRVERAAAGELEPGQALEQLDALRLLRRVAYHAWRILYHLRRCHLGGAVEGGEPADPGREIDVLEAD